jgi:hypothetical protein
MTIVTTRPRKRPRPAQAAEIKVPRIVQHTPRGRAWMLPEPDPAAEARAAASSPGWVSSGGTGAQKASLAVSSSTAAEYRVGFVLSVRTRFSSDSNSNYRLGAALLASHRAALLTGF